MGDEPSEAHVDVIRRLRACVERGNERVTMIDLPEEPMFAGAKQFEGKYAEHSTWEARGLTVIIAGPLPKGTEYMEGDLVVRFVKHARVDIQAWDQGDRSVWWQPGAEFIGESPWFTLNLG